MHMYLKRSTGSASDDKGRGKHCVFSHGSIITASSYATGIANEVGERCALRVSYLYCVLLGASEAFSYFFRYMNYRSDKMLWWLQP